MLHAPLVLLLSLVLLWSASVSQASPSSSQSTVYPVDKYYFDAIVDHYSFRPTPQPTFPLRYYVNEESWSRNNAGPVLFYSGNEANILQFINNSGFLFEVAEEFQAMVVFAEHRYYGESKIHPKDMSFLTVEQAMADFNTLNVHIREKWSMPRETAFIVFGGSYGANLALWLRLKNPNLWAGAIASSATPLKHILRETNDFARIETEVYGNVSSACPDLVREGWKELYGHAATEGGRSVVSEVLGLCDPLPDESAADDVHDWVADALETMVQYGYPYPTNYYNPVPGYPFKVACEEMLSALTILGALRAAVNIYYNYTGQAGSCYDFDDDVVPQAVRQLKRKGGLDRLRRQQHRGIQQKSKDGLRGRRLEEKNRGRAVMRDEEDDQAWWYQTCTEVYQPMPTNGITDFEVPYTPNQTAYYENCWERWRVQPRPNWEEMTFMGSHIGAGSNIFLTNGQLDPWRAAGIQEKPRGSPDSIVVRTLENAAHHLDLRASHELDPPDVVAVRSEQKIKMREWIEEWKDTCLPDRDSFTTAGLEPPPSDPSLRSSTS